MEYGDGKPNLLNLLLGANGQGDRVYSGCRALFTSVQLKGTVRSPSALTKTAGARLLQIAIFSNLVMTKIPVPE